MGLSFLDQWLVRRMGWAVNGTPSAGQVREWQLARLREIVAHAQANSQFYGRMLADVDAECIKTVEDFSRLPMITPDDVRQGPERMLCVSQDEIARVVTLESSGTTGRPKRIYHTQDDLEATVDFFDWGMRNMVGSGQTAFVLMPGERPGGVGRLLMEALGRTGARGVAHGVMEDAGIALDHLLSEEASCIVGSAAHVNLLVREWDRRRLPKGVIQSVLLCWDVVPDAVVRNVQRAFGCRVFRHWGMIETGLGGAVECVFGTGMHLRESDVFLEIVDPQTRRLVTDGEFGEIVVTTPMRRGMPLIRYRTGDLGRILPGGCVCGSPLRRLDSRIRRLSDGVAVGSGMLRLKDLNDALYAVSGLGDFAVWLDKETLNLRVCGDDAVRQRAERALDAVPAIADGRVRVEMEMQNDTAPAIPGLGKRRIMDRE